ncbi:SoxR reducing system protein RseC, partial [Vibrio parahaemolyticus]
LIRSALLVYLTPILGLFIFAGLAQSFSLEQFWIAMSGVAGGVIGFFIARKLASKWRDDEAFQPVVLQIGLP